MHFRVISFLLFFATAASQAQTPIEVLSYFPIEPGNSWTFRVRVDLGATLIDEFDSTLTIGTTDTLIQLNGKRYWTSSWGPMRVDSATGKVYIHPSYAWCTDSTEREFVNLSIDTTDNYYLCYLGLNEFWDVIPSPYPMTVGLLPIERPLKFWTARQESRYFADSIGLCYWQYWTGKRITWELIQASVYGMEYFPVRLASFEGLPTSDGVLLRWRTSEERDNMGFEIHRRSPDAPWKSLGFVPSAGRDNGAEYTYLDTEAKQQSNDRRLVYRLKQVDFDGTFWYSQEINVHRPLTSPAEAVLHISPHPVSDLAVLYIEGVDALENWNIQLSDMLGRTLLRDKLSMWDSSGGGMQLNLHSFSPGVYVISATDGHRHLARTLHVTR